MMRSRDVTQKPRRRRRSSSSKAPERRKAATPIGLSRNSLKLSWKTPCVLRGSRFVISTPAGAPLSRGATGGGFGGLLTGGGLTSGGFLGTTGSRPPVFLSPAPPLSFGGFASGGIGSLPPSLGFSFLAGLLSPCFSPSLLVPPLFSFSTPPLP